MPVLFDTCVLIDVLRGNEKALNFAETTRRAGRIYLSVATVQELEVGVRPSERNVTNRLLSTFNVVDINAGIAQLSGVFLKQYHPSHRIDVNDAYIAATTQAGGFDLATLNLKHFPMFEDLQAAY